MIDCGAAPHIHNSNFENSTSTLYGDVVEYRCKHGFVFPDNLDRNDIKCMNNSIWFGEYVDLGCRGMCSQNIPFYDSIT